MLTLLAATALAQQFVHEPTSSYKKMQMHGFTVYVSKAAQAKPEDTDPALTLLKEELAEVISLVPRPALTTLRRIPFFVEHANPGFPCACYHTSRDWLRENGYNLDKEHSVEIANPRNFVAWVKLNQPLMVLHELAHGYHDLKFGYSDRYISAVFTHGVALGSYESVAHNRGGNRRHYGLNNPMEFFAEASEAYFGENDFYPFNRDQLRTHHPQALEMVERCWGVR